jgi:hypothetical protein
VAISVASRRTHLDRRIGYKGEQEPRLLLNLLVHRLAARLCRLDVGGGDALVGTDELATKFVCRPRRLAEYISNRRRAVPKLGRVHFESGGRLLADRDLQLHPALDGPPGLKSLLEHRSWTRVRVLIWRRRVLRWKLLISVNFTCPRELAEFAKAVHNRCRRHDVDGRCAIAIVPQQSWQRVHVIYVAMTDQDGSNSVSNKTRLQREVDARVQHHPYFGEEESGAFHRTTMARKGPFGVWHSPTVLEVLVLRKRARHLD